jgi:hypothetical protein
MSPASCARKWIVLIGLLWAFPGVLLSQTNGLNSGDLPLTGSLGGDQVFPAVAFNATGGYLVFQDNATDPSGLGVSLRRLGADLIPQGAPVRVNQTLALNQHRAKVSMFADGGAVVVFQSGIPNRHHILARLLSPDGTFATGEILVNNALAKINNRFTTNWTLIHNNRPRTRRYTVKESIRVRHEFNSSPSLATLADGSVVVAWSSSRVYQTNSTSLREVITYPESKNYQAVTNRTRIAVSTKTAGMQDVYFQRLSATGEKLGGEVQANQFTAFNQRDASVAPLAGGGFVVVWVSERQRSSTFDSLPPGAAASPGILGASSVDVYARLYDAAGNPQTDEFLVNTETRSCSGPSVAPGANGGFTVAWSERSGVRTNGLDIFIRAFASNGSAASGAVRANTFTYGDQFAPSVAAVGGQQLVVWSSMGQDGSWEGVFAQAFNGAAPVGDEFRVNVSTPFGQVQPQVAGDAVGRAVVLWSGYTPGGTGFDVFGRTYLAP